MMTTLGGRLLNAVQLACPAIEEVSIGRKDDRSTWEIQFAADATDEQRAAAQAALEAFDPDIPDSRDYGERIQAMLDAAAAGKGYDTIHSIVSYRDDPNPVFAAEGKVALAWRSAVWSYAAAELAKVQAGERSAPTVAAFIAELPAPAWPG